MGIRRFYMLSIILTSIVLLYILLYISYSKDGLSFNDVKKFATFKQLIKKEWKDTIRNIRTPVRGQLFQQILWNKTSINEFNPFHLLKKASIISHNKTLEYSQGDSCGVSKPLRSALFNKYWYVFGGLSGKIHILSAHYDDRVEKYSYHIRMFAVSYMTKHQDLYCHVWYPGLKHPLISVIEQLKFGRGLQYNNKQVQEMLLSCKLPIIEVKPTSVSVSFGKCTQTRNVIPIIIPQRAPLYDFGICMVAATAGSLVTKELVEWVEFNKLLGVSEINICDSNMDENARAVFQYYRSHEGNVNIRPVAPAVDDWCYWCQKLSDLMCLNECLYKNMYRYKHTVVIDFDEIIIPHKADNLSQLLSNLKGRTTNEPLSYTFRNAYFFKDFGPFSKRTNHLMTSKYVTRIEPSNYGYSPKTIVNPRQCLVMQTHYCIHQLPQSGDVIIAPPQEGLSHHYKKCHFKPAECDKLLAKPIIDKAALKYTSILKRRVNTKLRIFRTQR